MRVSVCHCLACQRRTGSAFGVQARFAASDVAIEGASQAFVRAGDSGKSITFHFCPSCGSTVYWEVAGFIAVAVGAFADPSFLEPTLSVYEARKHAWVSLSTQQPMEHWD